MLRLLAMKRFVHLVLFCGLFPLGVVLGGSGCQKARPGAASGARPGTPEAPRRVEVTVSNQGFTPARVPGRPGESLTLVFKYEKSAGECGRQVLVPTQQKSVTLSEDKPTEVALTLPPTAGEVGFTCGMHMLHGAIVIE
jgi:plastocyanin domain-containing protein